MKVWLKAGVIIFYVLGYCFLKNVCGGILSNYLKHICYL